MSVKPTAVRGEGEPFPSATRVSPVSQEASWSAMMAAAQQGDRRAYEELLRAVLPYIRALIRRRRFAASDSEVEDIAQEALLSLHIVRHTYNPARPFAPWLAGIVRHRTLDYQRKNYRRRLNEVAFDGLSEASVPARPDAPQEQRDELAALLHAMAALSPGQRRAIELLKLRGLSLAQAAAETGTSITALKVAAHRALKCLRLSLAYEGM